MATPSDEDSKSVTSKFDALDDEYDVDGMYELMLTHKDSKDAEILWRLAYAVLEKGRKLGDDAKLKKAHVYQAFEHAKRALEMDDNNHNVLMWYCITLTEVGEYEGIKNTIANAHKCKEYLLKGLELEPTSAPLRHCLGVWCFEVASLSWVERKAASVVFATPPTSTYEEALQYFEDAEKTRPNFYIANDFMLAQTLLKLKRDKDRAKELLLKVANYNEKTFDEKDAKKHAKEVLNKEFSIKVT